MKKKIFDMKCYIEKRFKKRCEEVKVRYIGCFPEPGQTFPNSYKQHYDIFQKNLLKELIQIVKKQNVEYFKQKARDLMTEKDPDGLNAVTAKMLADSLKINLKDLMPPSHTVKKQIDSTAAASGQMKNSVGKSEMRTVAPFICSTINTVDRSSEPYQR